MHTPTHAHTHTRSYTLGKTCSNTIRQLDAFTETEIHNTEKRVRLVPLPRPHRERSKLNYKLITSYVNGNVECNFCCSRHRFLFLLLRQFLAHCWLSLCCGRRGQLKVAIQRHRVARRQAQRCVRIDANGFLHHFRPASLTVAASEAAHQIIHSAQRWYRYLCGGRHKRNSRN